MAPFQRKPSGTMLHGMQSFIPPTTVSLELGGLLGPCGAAHGPSARGCSTPMGEAQASRGAVLKERRGYAFARDLTCAKLCLQVLFLAVSFNPPRLPTQKCSCMCSLSGHPPVRGVQGTPAGPSAPAGVCSVLSQEGREKEEAGAKLLSHRRREPGAKLIHALQHLVDTCEPDSFCLLLESFWLGGVSWLVAVGAPSASACPTSQTPAPAARHGPGRDLTKIKAAKGLPCGSSLLLT